MPFSDYPQAATDNANRALEHREEYDSQCGTPVGWETARILSEREAISVERLPRIYSFLSRAKVYDQGDFFDSEKNEICGSVMFAAWGGDEMLVWAEETYKNSEEYKMEQEINRAEPGELELGDFVRWNSSNGFAYGRIIEIALEGELEADSGFVVNATEDDPAAKIRIFQFDSEIEAYVEQEPALNVVHRFSTLEKFAADVRKNIPIMERRTTTQRADVNGQTIAGYAAVFNSPSEDLGGFIEYIAPGAFDSVMNDDVRGFYNHDYNYLLGRASSGTLRLSTDERGLRYEIDLPNTTYANDLIELMRRGDVNQSSFAFMIESDSWSVKGKQNIRTITKISRLIDVAPVVIPAYPAATSQLVTRALNTDAEVQTSVADAEPVGSEIENVDKAERPNLRSLLLRIINLNS
jgi:HK97 family phage prohead protease